MKQLDAIHYCPFFNYLWHLVVTTGGLCRVKKVKLTNIGEISHFYGIPFSFGISVKEKN